jgi:hypothetical protein
VARTPHIDALAAKGIVFEHCYAMPVCAPSRFSLIAGCIPRPAVRPTTCGPPEKSRLAEGFPTYLRGRVYTSNRAKTDYNSPLDLREMWDACGRQADWKNRPTSDTPFFGVCNYEVCHESCLFPEKKKFGFAPTDPASVRVAPYQPDTPEVRADIARQYDCLAEMDRQVGEELQKLETAGLAENTIVFYYGDNGGITPRSKRFLQDTGIHVPWSSTFPPNGGTSRRRRRGRGFQRRSISWIFPPRCWRWRAWRGRVHAWVPFAGDPDAKPGPTRSAAATAWTSAMTCRGR